MAEKSLVLGGTGFLGSHLLPLLEDAVLYRRDDGLFDEPSLRRVMQGCRVVYNLAACTSLLGQDGAQRQWVNADFVKLLVSAVPKGVRLVHCSTAGAVGFTREPVVLDEDSPCSDSGIHYFQTKREGEHAALSCGKDVVVVNPGMCIAETGMRAVQTEAFRRALRGEMPFYPPGGASFAYAPDVARGMILAAAKGKAGKRYILGGTNLTYKEYFGRIAALGRVAPPRVPLPRVLLPLGGWAVEALLGGMGADSGRMAAGFGYYSSERARTELGYDISPLDTILKRIYDSIGGSSAEANTR